jgi:hypothetical protein
VRQCNDGQAQETASDRAAGGGRCRAAFTGGVALHDLFQQQVRRTLDDSDLDEDAKQAILVAMNCPCCGAGGINYTAKIRRRT